MKNSELKYTVYHKFPHHTEYSKRGEILLTTSRATAKYIGNEPELSIEDLDHDYKSMKSKFYLVKIVDNENPNHVTKSFTYLCLLKSSNLEDEIIIHLDKNNRIFQFDYYTSSDQCNNTIVPQSRIFKTTVQTIKAIDGVVPKLNKAMPSIREDGTVEKPPEEKSFMQKYWQADYLIES
ncbi:14466_t:CDS:2 [Funneliformis geosporum]|uniref:32_t:CDS:1 n=1 Tax=Funneliformis geosporum TaxID=1117311 RepID=A0A9W4SEN8_9GLOM|nr:32_t:CDS:2 [Funneliformis geosporum]CAI2167296.1 14466_t:CDS:2 [Funneliformis geosporum]